MKKVRRVYGGKNFKYSSPPVNDRTTRGHYQSGFTDGRYHGVRPGDKPKFPGHVPISQLWYDEADQRRYCVHHYSLGFWFGQVSCLPRDTQPPRDYWTLSDHRLLAKVRDEFYFLGEVEDLIGNGKLQRNICTVLLPRVHSESFVNRAQLVGRIPWQVGEGPLVGKGGDQCTQNVQSGVELRPLEVILQRVDTTSPKSVSGGLNVFAAIVQVLPELGALLLLLS